MIPVSAGSGDGIRKSLQGLEDGKTTASFYCSLAFAKVALERELGPWNLSIITPFDTNGRISQSKLQTIARSILGNNGALLAPTIETLVDTKSIATPKTIRDKDGKVSALLHYNPPTPVPTTADTTQLVFILAGQGGQWIGMGSALYSQYKVVQSTITKADSILSYLGSDWLPLTDAGLLNLPNSRGSTTLKQELDQLHLDVNISLIASGILQLAYIDLLQSWGLSPTLCIGHSAGEISAAYASGAINLTTAISLLYARANVMRKLRDGKMMVVNTSGDMAKGLLEDRKIDVWVAASNSYTACTLTGLENDIQNASNELGSHDLSVKIIEVGKPFHSPYLDEFRDQFIQAVANLRFGAPKTAYVSCVTGKLYREILDAEYWWLTIRSEVKFASALGSLRYLMNARSLSEDMPQLDNNSPPVFMPDSKIMFVEIAPRPTLARHVTASMPKQPILSCAAGPSVSPVQSLMELIGQLHVRGCTKLINWRVFLEHNLSDFDWDGLRRTVDLSHRHDWNHQTFLPKFITAVAEARDVVQPVEIPTVVAQQKLKPAVSSAQHELEPTSSLARHQPAVLSLPSSNRKNWAYIADHRVDINIVFPGMGYLSLVQSKSSRSQVISFKDIYFEQMCILDRKALEDTDFEPPVDVFNGFDGSFHLTNSSSRQLVYCRGIAEQVNSLNESKGINDIRAEMGNKVVTVSNEAIYERASSLGLNYGSAFRLVDNVLIGKQWALGTLKLDILFKLGVLTDNEINILDHPSILDACLHPILTLELERGRVTVPSKCGQFSFKRTKVPVSRNSTVVSACRLASITNEKAIAEVFVFSERGEFLGEMRGFEFTMLKSSDSDSVSRAKELIHEIGYKKPVNNVGDTQQLQFMVLVNEDSTLLQNCNIWNCKVATSLQNLEVRDLVVMDIRAVSKPNLKNTLATLQTLQSRFHGKPAIFVTSGQQICNQDGDSALSVAGIVRCFRVESETMTGQKWPILIVEIDSMAASTDLDVISEVLAKIRSLGSTENWTTNGEIRLHNDGALAKSVFHVQLPSRAPGQIQSSLTWESNSGQISKIQSRQLRPRTSVFLPEGCVDVKVDTVSLHFKDALCALNKLPGIKYRLGMEVSGVVHRSSNPFFSPGDFVYTSRMSGGFMATDISVNPGTAVIIKIAQKPSPDYVGTFAVLATVLYGLRDLARVQPRDTVLVHAAAGGVGQAAIKYLQMVGAKIIGSASTKKHQFLKDMYGLDHVINSRDPKMFYSSIMEITKGAGVNVVLNSLSGEGLTESMKCLSPRGRFVEIGKVDILKDSKLGMNLILNNISLLSCHIDLLPISEQYRLLNDTKELLDSGHITPIDATCFPISKISDALRQMVTGSHVGKLCLDMNDSSLPTMALQSLPASPFSEDGSYLFTGAFGGVGLRLAQWAANSGARSIILTTSRPLDKSLTENPIVVGMRSNGVEVAVVSCDVSKHDQIVKLFETSTRPIKGIFHLANKLDDSLIKSINVERLNSVLMPKAIGAWNLHQITQRYPVDLFVLFSSVAGCFGNRGQANYGAANAYLDSLATQRRNLGLSGVSISLPMIDGAGILDVWDHLELRKRLLDQNLQAISIPDLTHCLEFILDPLSSSPTNVVLYDHWHTAPISTMRVPSDWLTELLPGAISKYGSKKVLSNTPSQKPVQEPQPPAKLNVSAPTASHTTISTSKGNLAIDEKAVTVKISELLGLGDEGIDPNVPLTMYGLDSLASVELYNFIKTEYGFEIPQASLLGEDVTIKSILSLLEGQDISGQLHSSKSEMPQSNLEPLESAGQNILTGNQTEIVHGTTNKQQQSLAKPKASYESLLKSKICSLLGLTIDEVDSAVPLQFYGLDSLASVELFNYIKSELGVDIPQAMLLDENASISSLTELIASHDVVATTDDSLYQSEIPSTPAGLREHRLLQTEGDSIPQIPTMSPSDVHQMNSSPQLATTSKLEKAHLQSTPPVKLSQYSAQANVIVDATDSVVNITINRPERDNAMTEEMLDIIIASISPDKIIVVDSIGPHFCTGWDLWSSDAGFQDAGMQRSILKCGILIEKLKECTQPIISVCRGSVRGGGMLFPCMSDIVIAETSTSFAFPEIRLGGIPGVVSVAAINKIPQHIAKRMMLLGENVSAENAKSFGLVDIIAESKQSMEIEKRRIVGKFVATDATLRALTKSNIADPYISKESAIIRIGQYNSSVQERTKLTNTQRTLVRLIALEEGIVAIELDNPPGNGMTVEMGIQFASIVKELRSRTDVRCIILRGKGDHFCSGGDLLALSANNDDLAQFASKLYQVLSSFASISTIPVPIIAELKGKAVGGGLAFSLNADWRVALSSTKFSVGLLPRGMCPGIAMSKNLEAFLGRSQALSLYLDDTEFSSDMALDLQLVNVVANSTVELEEMTLRKARELSRYSTTGLNASLRLFRPQLDESTMMKEAFELAVCLSKIKAERGASFASFRDLKTATPTSNNIPPAITNSSMKDMTPSQRHSRREEEAMDIFREYTPRSVTASTVKTQRLVENVGILDLAVSIPKGMVDMAELEVHDGVPGKYTSGLGLKKMSVTGSNQDSVSMALNAVEKLLQKTGINPNSIGRIEVGTETPVDISKPITTFLTRLFGPNSELEGADSVSACYGGTAAFFNAVSWIQSSQWNGKLAIVVATDVYQGCSELHYLAGAGAVAMLIGPNANVVLSPHRGNVMLDSWDFYRPLGKMDGVPTVKARESVETYVHAASICHGNLTRLVNAAALNGNAHAGGVVSRCDNLILHCTTASMARRGLDALLKTEDSGISAVERHRIYESKVKPTLLANEQMGALYTVAIWMSLAVLLSKEGQNAVGKNILMFSFGSGATASLFELQVKSPISVIDFDKTFHDRTTVSIEDYIELRKTFGGDLYRMGRIHGPSNFAVPIRKGDWFLSEGNVSDVIE
ncbi:hypothetical protein HDU76_012478 [Blyttiomyces sp. JEL0837]|nr:hypothetical protein HDU76_012478 [Blyttiomyces sp. JEL0837]